MEERFEKGDDRATVQRERAAGHTQHSFLLEVTGGPTTGARFTVDASQPSRVYLGTSRLCEVRVEDPEVSRRHLALEVTGGGLQITDMKSTNGTLVNGILVRDAVLRGGEVIAVGSTRVLVQASGTAIAPRLHQSPRFGRVVGSSPEMRRLYPLLSRLAASDVPIIIEGETGTGKELLAESIHEQSRRAQGPFVVFDCTAVPPGLVESALFGHERGAFTGAVNPRRGVFEQAHGGTLLIDEIGDLEIGLQAKLLRAIERSEVQRVGGTSWIKVDVRLLCATRRDLERAIQENRFRDDLYYRLAVARIELPPLRRRTGDIKLLAEYMWKTLGGKESPIPQDFVTRLEQYSWPGNVRELHNAVVHQLALGDLAEVQSLWRRKDPTGASAEPPAAAAEEGPRSSEPGPAVEGRGPTSDKSGGDEDIIAGVLAQELPFPMARENVLRAFERRYVEWVVERHGGNMTKAAAASGIARRSLYAIKSRGGSR